MIALFKGGQVPSFSRLLVIVFACALSSGAFAKCRIDETADNNTVYWIDDFGKKHPLKKGAFDRYEIEDYLLSGERNFRFVAKLRKHRYDTPAVIKVTAWSTKDGLEDTSVVLLMIDKGRGRVVEKAYSLERYQKHHRGGVKRDDSWLEGNFHRSYRDENRKVRRTDDTDEKRRKFNFAGVPNTYRGGLLALLGSLVLPQKALARVRGENYVYLKALIKDLRREPCFNFSVRIPKGTERVVLDIVPIPERVMDNFGVKRWRLQSNAK